MAEPEREGSTTEKILKAAVCTIAAALFVILFFFAMTWYSDGFSAAWELFFVKGVFKPILELCGFKNWAVGSLIAIAVAGVAEFVVGRRLSKRSTGFIVDAAAFVVTLYGYAIIK